MKKTYQKPGIYVENFSLSQSIASTCGAAKPDGSLGRPLQATKETCGWGDEHSSFWLDGVTTCKTAWDDSPTGFVCYNNPEGGMNIFGWS